MSVFCLKLYVYDQTFCLVDMCQNVIYEKIVCEKGGSLMSPVAGDTVIVQQVLANCVFGFFNDDIFAHLRWPQCVVKAYFMGVVPNLI